jgi:PAS domain S-box-containing protein
MVSVVWLYYTVEKEDMEAAAVRTTVAVAAGKVDQVANWRRERIGDGHVAMSSPVQRTASRVLSSRTPSSEDRADLLDLMNRLAGSFLYTDVSLVDLDGNILVRLHDDGTDSAQFDQNSRKDLARQAEKAGDVVLSDLTLQTRSGRPMMALSVPVRHLGAFILDIDPSRFLYPRLKTWPDASPTGTTILFRIEGNQGVFLNGTHYEEPKGHFLSAPLPPNVAWSLLDSGWSSATPDYRGVPVVRTARRIPNSPWYLSCKIDVAEVVAPVRRLAWEMGLITALIGFANAAGVGTIWRGQQARVHREREAWFYAVAHDTPAYLWMASSGEEISFINGPFRKYLGTDQESLSKDWTDYVHPEDAGRARSSFLEAMAHARAYTEEFRIRRFDGEYRTVVSEAVPRFSSKGQFLGFAGSIVDITGRRRAEEQLRTTNATLETELAKRIRSEQKIRSLSAKLIEAREDERKRIARELHDDLNQQVAAVSIAMGNLKRHIPQAQVELRDQSDQIHQNLVRLAENVSRMSHELHPAILDYYGLGAALHECCDEFAALTGIRILLDTRGSFEGVPPSIALSAYRIVQEALQNVAKHAHADTARIELTHLDGMLRLTVSDSGIGMDPDSVETRTGVGLMDIKERARLAGGSVDIRSKPNQGTSLTVEIPV